MTIQPFIKCSVIQQSVVFYTSVLDFKLVQPPDADPASFMSEYASIERDGCKVHLSSHDGDGVFGNVIYIEVDNIDRLYLKFISNGLNTESSLRIPPVEQSWGMKEFSVSDPDGNKMTFGHRL